MQNYHELLSQILRSHFEGKTLILEAAVQSLSMRADTEVVFVMALGETKRRVLNYILFEHFLDYKKVANGQMMFWTLCSDRNMTRPIFPSRALPTCAKNLKKDFQKRVSVRSNW